MLHTTKTWNTLFYYMAESVFAMRLVNLPSVTCFTDQNFKENAHFGALNLFTEKKGLNKVIRRLSTLRTWMFTLSFNILNMANLFSLSRKPLLFAIVFVSQ